MKILYLAHRLPYPPNKGEKLRAFHQIRYLSKRHTLHLACLADDPEDLEHIKTLETFCASVDVIYRSKAAARRLGIMAIANGKPLSLASFYLGELQRKIDQRINTERVDVVYVFSAAMAEYVRHLRKIPKMIDFVDADSEKWRDYAQRHPLPMSWVYRLEAERLARYESEAAGLFDRSIFISEKEANLVRSRVNGVSISVITNGVDTEFFHFKRACSIDSSRIVFTGTMDYFPNVDAVQYFCRDIFPLIKKDLPGASFDIVGRNPTRRVTKLARQPGVNITGSVADIRPYLHRAAVAVAPFQLARGVQNKVLEAMATGVPVVGTSLAFQGLAVDAKSGIRKADDPSLFARWVVALITDTGLRQRCSRQAVQYVRAHHNWEEHGARLEQLIEEAVRGGAIHREQVGIA
ncbi:MAG: TIGR03087 family PEP-CTERM/XrtA system glycosyltransferase [Deltaproteobacteria bacterium]|nr:TIGR03087 family PEP-CTERM/XrtA system glycosyltransferase [Deltaproteobacteria bacterium]